MQKKTPLLFGKRVAAPPTTPQQYAGTTTELDQKVSDRTLKTDIVPLVPRKD